MGEPLIGPTRLFMILSLGLGTLVILGVLTWDSYQRDTSEAEANRGQSS